MVEGSQQMYTGSGLISLSLSEKTKDVWREGGCLKEGKGERCGWCGYIFC